MSDDEQGVVIAAARADGARLLVSGRLDSAGADRLRALLDDVCTPGAVVSVDLSHAASLPLDAVRALLEAHRRLQGGRGRLVLDQPSAVAARVLRTSGLHRVLDVHGWPFPQQREPDAGSPARADASG